MAGQEGYVQVATDGSGKKVRNLLLKGVLQPDGTTADVYVQCVSVVDSDGNALDFNRTNELLSSLVREVHWLRLAFIVSHQGDDEIADAVAEAGGLEEHDDDDEAEDGEDDD